MYERNTWMLGFGLESENCCLTGKTKLEASSLNRFLSASLNKKVFNYTYKKAVTGKIQ